MNWPSCQWFMHLLLLGLTLQSKGSFAFSRSPVCHSLTISTASNKRNKFILHSTTIDAKTEQTKATKSQQQSNGLLVLKDILPISLFTIYSLAMALLFSTYEDYDVTHVRPNPSTLRHPTSSSGRLNYLGAATKGMGWGLSDRLIDNENKVNQDNLFEEWYGSSATILQWKPSYNEIMLEHRLKRVPRWDTDSFREEEMQQAVANLYKSLDELDSLKVMADDYQWEEIKEMLSPNNKESAIRNSLEYSMDVLKTAPITQHSGEDLLFKQPPEVDLSSIIGFDWGSCAWRHCGAKADGQEALAELYSSVGMLEPFEVRFVVDIIERSIRDVLAVVPEELLPHNNGVVIQTKPYAPYVSQADLGLDETGSDSEYAQILSDLRVDLSD